MNPKIEINMDSTSLGNSACLENYNLTVLQGYKTLPKDIMVYGIAGHKFVDTMFKTDSNFKLAREDLSRSFNIKKIIPISKINRTWISDEKHLLTTCYDLWEDFISKDTNEMIALSQDCYWCKGQGTIANQEDAIACDHCEGTGTRKVAATEITFRIKFYEDEHVIVYLTGTIDRILQISNGIPCIRDWKFTTAWDKDDFLQSFEMSRQLRMYTLAFKLMAEQDPESVLGKIGSQRLGACIDGIFLKPKIQDIEHKSSQVFQFSDSDIEQFRAMVYGFCMELSYAIQHNIFPKQGILNGTCEGKFDKCKFWNVCKVGPDIRKMLLKRDFQQKQYNPLAFNE
jgi:hypothetical protein